MYKNRYRARSALKILSEIDLAFTRFPLLKSVYFDDDTFNVGKQRMLEICEGMKRLRIPWSAMCRADTSDAETFSAMKSSGCYAVKFGVESGCQELVDRCNKKLDLRKVEEAVRLLKSMGVFVHVTFTWGLPGETRKTIEMTREFYRRIKPDSAQQSFCTPFPGTPFFEMLKKVGNFDIADWSNLDGARGSILNSEALRTEELMTYAKLDD